MLDTISGPVLYKTPLRVRMNEAQCEEKVLMTIKPTIEHKANWLLSGTTPSVIYLAMCASRLTSSASFGGRVERGTFLGQALDRRPNRF